MSIFYFLEISICIFFQSYIIFSSIETPLIFILHAHSIRDIQKIHMHTFLCSGSASFDNNILDHNNRGCGLNEVFSNCGQDGCRRTCNRLDVTNCIPVCTVPSCVCASGFVRNAQGVCVSPAACREDQLFIWNFHQITYSKYIYFCSYNHTMYCTQRRIFPVWKQRLPKDMQ